MEINALGNKVIIKKKEADTKSKGGILLNTSIKDASQIAEVISVGPGNIDKDGNIIPLTVKVGEQILVGKNSGLELKLDGVMYYVIKEDEILAIVN